MKWRDIISIPLMIGVLIVLLKYLDLNNVDEKYIQLYDSISNTTYVDEPGIRYIHDFKRKMNIVMWKESFKTDNKISSIYTMKAAYYNKGDVLYVGETKIVDRKHYFNVYYPDENIEICLSMNYITSLYLLNEKVVNINVTDEKLLDVYVTDIMEFHSKKRSVVYFKPLKDDIDIDIIIKTTKNEYIIKLKTVDSGEREKEVYIVEE